MIYWRLIADVRDRQRRVKTGALEWNSHIVDFPPTLYWLRVIPMLILLCEFAATLAAGLFAGAALYINVAEHPSGWVLRRG